MLATILGIAGVGGIGALAFIFPPFGALLLSAGKAALGFLQKLSPTQIIIGVLGIALVAQHIIDHRHAAKIEGQLTKASTQLASTRSAFATTVANYRAAAAKAAADDKANTARVQAQQSQINQETSDEYENRLAAARAAAQRLRNQLAQTAAHPSSGAGAAVPGVSTAASGPAQSASDGLSIDDKLTATEQGIQLDELIKWVKKQAAVDVNGAPAPAPK